MTETSELTILRHIEAWRFWRVAKLPGPPEKLIMKSIFHDYSWCPTPNKAVCISRPGFPINTPHSDEIPDFDCNCGFYGFKPDGMSETFKKNMRTSRSIVGNFVGGIVIGKVALWGTVIEHETGYRGELAYPLSLCGAICCFCNRLVALEDSYLYRSNVGDIEMGICCSWCRLNFQELFFRRKKSDFFCDIKRLLVLAKQKQIEDVEAVEFLGPCWHLELTSYYGIKVERSAIEDIL